MSLADRLAEPQADKGGRSCPLCDLLPTLPKKERDALNVALAQNAKRGGWSARTIRDALHDEGHDHITKPSVEHHRREHLS